MTSSADIVSSPGLAREAGQVRGRRPADRRRGRWWGLALAAGWLVQAGLRAWLSRAQMVPLATPDESAYLIAARVLAGGAPANFSYSTLYPAGYPLLIAPVYWFTHDPVTVYHAVLLGINAPISALIMPLGYVACRRLGLDRPWAFGVAMVAALVPAALFYSQYAMTDAIYPVLVAAWLLAVHSWLTARSVRGQYLAAAGSAVAAGYAYAVHSRGAVIVVGYVLVGAVAAGRRLVPRGTAAAAAVALVLPLGAAWLVNRHVSSVMYPSGPRTLAGEALIRLRTVHGVIFVLEMAAGQMWRFVLDGWGVTGLGLAAAIFVIFRRGVRDEVRIMAALAAGVTLVTAVTSPAALPPTQPQAWASGRYLDGMVVAFFMVGAVVLLRAAPRLVAADAAVVAVPTVLAAIVVARLRGRLGAHVGVRRGVRLRRGRRADPGLDHGQRAAGHGGGAGPAGRGGGSGGRGGRRDGSGPAVAGWPARRARGGQPGRVGPDDQPTSPGRHARPGAEHHRPGDRDGAAPGQRLAIGTGLSWTTWMPQAYEVWWAPLEFFTADAQPPPADATVVEVAWPSGQSAASSWPQAPTGWKIVLADRADGWVAWRR